MESSSQSVSRGPTKPVARRHAVRDWTSVSRESSLSAIEVHCISDTDEHAAPVPTCTPAVSGRRDADVSTSDLAAIAVPLVTVSNLERSKSPSEPQRPARTDEEVSASVPTLQKRNCGRTPAIVDHEARQNTRNTSQGLVCLKLPTAQPKRKRGRPRKQTRAAVTKRVEAEQPEEETDVKAEDDGLGDLGSVMTRSKRVGCQPRLLDVSNRVPQDPLHLTHLFYPPIRKSKSWRTHILTWSGRDNTRHLLIDNGHEHSKAAKHPFFTPATAMKTIVSTFLHNSTQSTGIHSLTTNPSRKKILLFWSVKSPARCVYDSATLRSPTSWGGERGSPMTPV